MASNDESSSLRRPRQDVRSSCRIDENKHVKFLPASALDELGHKMSEDVGGMSIWKKTGDSLGLSDDEIDQIENSKTSDPGCAVLKIWKRGRNSTILVLKNVFRQLRRNDLVETLEKFQLFEVSITVQCRYEGELRDMSNHPFHGRKTFKDYFITFLPSGMFSNAQRYVAALDASLELRWESFVYEFRGKHCLVELTSEKQSLTQQQQQPQRQSEALSPRVNRDIPERNAISLIDIDLIFKVSELPAIDCPNDEDSADGATNVQDYSHGELLQLDSAAEDKNFRTDSSNPLDVAARDPSSGSGVQLRCTRVRQGFVVSEDQGVNEGLIGENSNGAERADDSAGSSKPHVQESHAQRLKLRH